MPATDAGETSGICNLRPRPTNPEDTTYIDATHESLNIQCLYRKEVSNQLYRLDILKMPAADAGKTSGICNQRPRPTSLEDTYIIMPPMKALTNTFNAFTGRK